MRDLDCSCMRLNTVLYGHLKRICTQTHASTLVHTHAQKHAYTHAHTHTHTQHHHHYHHHHHHSTTPFLNRHPHLPLPKRQGRRHPALVKWRCSHLTYANLLTTYNKTLRDDALGHRFHDRQLSKIDSSARRGQ